MDPETILSQAQYKVQDDMSARKAICEYTPFTFLEGYIIGLLGSNRIISTPANLANDTEKFRI